MRLFLFLAISCLALHNGKGAPRTAVYKFVRCNPDGDQANCVTQKSPEMEWSPDLPSKLPASTAEDLEAEPEEDERPPFELEEEEDEEGMEEDETLMIDDKGESSEDGSGFEGSAAGVTTEPAESSGEDMLDMKRLFPNEFLLDEAKPEEEELKDDHLLQLTK